ncbi:MAG: hypothetical protein IJN90_02710 [Bacilli bacterium]|nr:hypothetical protein [Bacilli bacterium]
MDYEILGIFISALIGGYLFSQLLKKINYELKGFEIIIYQLAFLLVFHLGKYNNFDYYQKYLGIFLFIMVGIYYFLRSIKTKKYIEITSIVLLIMSIMFNYLSIKSIPYDLSKSVFIISGLSILSVIVIDFMILFAMKTNLNIENKPKKNKAILTILTIFTFLNIIYGYVGNILLEKRIEEKAIDYLKNKYSQTTEYQLLKEDSFCEQYECEYRFKTNNKYEYYDVEVRKDTEEIKSEFKHCISKKECNTKAEDVAKQYLNKKYGKFDYETNNDLTECNSYRCYVMFDSKYTNEPFEVTVDKESFHVDSDDFLVLYFSKLLDEDFYSTYSLENVILDEIEEQLEEEYSIKYEIDLSLYSSYFDQDLDEIYFGKIPTIEDLKKYAVISISDLEIKKVFNANQLNEFNEYIISMYEDFYKNKLTTSKTLFFDFAYDNPFNTQGVGSYKYGGYIRDAGSLYMIYLQPTPYKIDK